MAETNIRRLTADDAEAVVNCFHRVYGDSYANALFYDVARMRDAMVSGALHSVGAVTADGRVLAHMAMTIVPDARIPELGNTVVDPDARGGGIAWQVGAELTRWCRELGYAGFLHYPTTDHHIMQRHSVKTGFETGLMLGYIPAETDGKVQVREAHRRQAATIVYEPLGEAAAGEGYRPAYGADLLDTFVASTGLERRWQTGTAAAQDHTTSRLEHVARRGLARLRVRSVGSDLDRALASIAATRAPCRQIDFDMADPAIGTGVDLAPGPVTSSVAGCRVSAPATSTACSPWTRPLPTCSRRW